MRFFWNPTSAWSSWTTIEAKGAKGLDGWVLGTANALSSDGKVIAGHGAGPHGFEGWVATLPATGTGTSGR